MNQAEKCHADNVRAEAHEAQLAQRNARLHHAVKTVLIEMYPLTSATPQSRQDTLYQYLNRIVPRLHNATEQIYWLLTSYYVPAADCLQQVDELESEYENLEVMDLLTVESALPTSEQQAIQRQVSETVTTLKEQIEPLKTLPETELNAEQRASLSVTNDKLQLQIKKLELLLLAYFVYDGVKLQAINQREQSLAVGADLLAEVQVLDKQTDDLQETDGHREHRNLQDIS